MDARGSPCLMDAPKCRLCGKKHYGLCEFKDAEASDGEVRGGGRERRGPPLGSEAAGGDSATAGSSPLTNAERQKLYRQRRGEEYREWNRERMRRIRNGMQKEGR